MYIKPSYYRNKFDSHFRHVKKSRNDLNIGRVEYIRDYQREQLVILIECDLRFNTEVNAFIQEDKLIIESFHSTEYIKPFKTHLIKKETLADYEKGEAGVEFSEVQLNLGFKYSMLSCQMIKDGLINVILSFQRIYKKDLKYN